MNTQNKASLEEDFTEQFGMYASLGKERLYNGSFDNSVRLSDVVDYIKKNFVHKDEVKDILYRIRVMNDDRLRASTWESLDELLVNELKNLD